MAQGDVSFTFMDRVKEVELNIEDGRWQSALALALTLPDICGGIAFPEIVKKYRDGRTMMDRQKNPTRDVGGQYIRWFDEYAFDYFKIKPEDESPYICGERCWQLRCEYLHQNRGFLNPEDETGIRFHLGVNCGASVCQTKGNTREEDGITDIRIDIEQFCWRMCAAAKNYYFLLISKEKSLRRNKGGSCKAKTTGNYGYGRRIASDSRKTGRNVKLTGICTWRAWESFWTSSALLF